MEPLQRVPFDLVPQIVTALRPDGQHSIVQCQLLEMHAECKKILPSVDMRLYTPGGTIDIFGTFLIYIPEHRGNIVFHTMCEDEDLLVQRLQEVDIAWEQNAWFGPIHERFRSVMLRLVEAEKLSFIKPLNDAYNLSMTREQALGLQVKVPENLTLRAVTIEDAEFINSRWPHQDESTLPYIRNNIRVRDGAALCDKVTGEMLSWALFCLVGGIGMIQTAEQHRGKGYARIVATALTISIARTGVDPQVQVNIDLLPSYTLFQKIGYTITHNLHWYRLRRF